MVMVKMGKLRKLNTRKENDRSVLRNTDVVREMQIRK